MIAFVRGSVASRTPESVVLDVGGIGYEVVVPTRTRVGAIGDELTLYTHLHVREDCMTLYGFDNMDDRAVFELLISVTGIGPKGAISILSSISPVELRRAIATGNLDRLTAIPGIGRKTAQRIVLELKEKLADVVEDDSDLGAEPDELGDDARSEAAEALIALGFSPHEARRSVSLAIRALKSSNASLTTDSILRRALASAGRR